MAVKSDHKINNIKYTTWPYNIAYLT
jgi:hypothetical protein